MTEAEWLASDDTEEMYFFVVGRRTVSRRKIDLYCVACSKLVTHLIHAEDGKAAFEWLEEHPGQRERPHSGGHLRDLFRGPAQQLFDAHERRSGCPTGAAIKVAFDLWADWYEYAFPNVYEWFEPFPTALRDDPRVYLPGVTRDIFGNPFRTAAFDVTWRTSTAIALSHAIYADRAFDRMPILADALQDAGCEDPDILDHCRGDGPHVRGCWVVDLILGKK